MWLNYFNRQPRQSLWHYWHDFVNWGSSLPFHFRGAHRVGGLGYQPGKFLKSAASPSPSKNCNTATVRKNAKYWWVRLIMLSSVTNASSRRCRGRVTYLLTIFHCVTILVLLAIYKYISHTLPYCWSTQTILTFHTTFLWLSAQLASIVQVTFKVLLKTSLTNPSHRKTTEQLFDSIWVCDPPPATLLRYNIIYQSLFTNVAVQIQNNYTVRLLHNSQCTEKKNTTTNKEEKRNH